MEQLQSHVVYDEVGGLRGGYHLSPDAAGSRRRAQHHPATRRYWPPQRQRRGRSARLHPLGGSGTVTDEPNADTWGAGEGWGRAATAAANMMSVSVSEEHFK